MCPPHIYIHIHIYANIAVVIYWILLLLLWWSLFFGMSEWTSVRVSVCAFLLVCCVCLHEKSFPNENPLSYTSKHIPLFQSVVFFSKLNVVVTAIYLFVVFFLFLSSLCFLYVSLLFRIVFRLSFLYYCFETTIQATTITVIRFVSYTDMYSAYV